MAVWIGFDHDARAYSAAGARSVVDDHRLVENGRQALTYHARGDVSAAARRVADNQAHRACRICTVSGAGCGAESETNGEQETVSHA